ncbi:MAG: tRNA (adenosine(37)-N6)-threonylcarbamoyltransferase complex dimerization subunit type 1 TsaB, partial [Pseudomonadota bacterium]
ITSPKWSRCARLPPNPTILGFDTSAAHVAAAVVSGDLVLADHFEDRPRGQDEVLFGVLENVLTKAKLAWADLDGIAVGVGPGNFTGVRISVAAAKGLGVSLGIPVRGVSGFEQALHLAPKGAAAAIIAPRGQFYVSEPRQGKLCTAQEAAEILQYAKGLVGLGADALADQTGIPFLQTMHAGMSTALLAAADWGNDWGAVKPLYLKPADAAPPRNPAPTIVP